MLLHVFCKRSGLGSLAESVDAPLWHDSYFEASSLNRRDTKKGFKFEVVRIDKYTYTVEVDLSFQGYQIFNDEGKVVDRFVLSGKQNSAA